jgi:hypothetical protein
LNDEKIVELVSSSVLQVAATYLDVDLCGLDQQSDDWTNQHSAAHWQ